MPRTMTFETSLGVYGMYTEVPVATEKELLEFANKVREAGGANVIEALLPSEPGNPFECLIANALNFSCHVRPADDGFPADGGFPRFVSGARAWFMNFPENMADQRIEKIAKAVGCDTVERGLEGLVRVMTMVLPEHIGNAAAAFDEGAAFEEFGEYHDRD